MTNAQERRFGRAAMLATRLAREVDELSYLRIRLFEEVSALAGNDVAHKMEDDIMLKNHPTMGLGEFLAQLLDVMENEDRKE